MSPLRPAVQHRARIAGFVAALCLPMILIVAGRDPEFPLPSSIGDAMFFPGEFKYYVSHRLPLRDRLARWHSGVLERLNGPSEVGRVIVGKDGWLFLRLDRQMALHSVPYPRLRELRRQFEERAALCAQLGVQYRLLVVPAKENAYSEFLPDRYRRFAQRDSQWSVVGRFMRTKAEGVPTVDLLARFLEEKEKGDLYFKTDSHWNEFGGFIAAEELRRSLTPAGEPFQPKPYSIQWRETIGGNEAKILGIQDRVTERYPRVIVHDGRHPRMADGSPVKMDTINLDTFDLKGTRTRCPDAARGSVIVFHDSFGVALLPFVAREYRKALFMWHGFLPDLVRRERPEVVVDLHTSF